MAATRRAWSRKRCRTSSATSRSGLRGLQRHHAAQGGGLRLVDELDAARRAVGAANTIWPTAAASTAQHRRHGLHAAISTRARRAGATAPPASCSAPAARRGRSSWRSGVRDTEVHPSAQPHADTAEDVAIDHFGPRSRPATGRSRGACRERRAARQHDLARHAGHAADSICLGALPRRCVVTDIVYVPLVTPLLAGGAGARPRHRRRPRHAAAPGGAGLRALVRRAPEVTAGAARARGRDIEGL